MRLYNDFWDRFIPALKRGEYPEKVSYETVEEKEMFYDEEFY